MSAKILGFNRWERISAEMERNKTAIENLIINSSISDKDWGLKWKSVKASQFILQINDSANEEIDRQTKTKILDYLDAYMINDRNFNYVCDRYETLGRTSGILVFIRK